MVRADGTVKVLDFGRQVAPAVSTSTARRTHELADVHVPH
jgi:hypothetical protein